MKTFSKNKISKKYSKTLDSHNRNEIFISIVERLVCGQHHIIISRTRSFLVNLPPHLHHLLALVFHFLLEKPVRLLRNIQTSSRLAHFIRPRTWRRDVLWFYHWVFSEIQKYQFVGFWFFHRTNINFGMIVTWRQTGTFGTSRK